MNFPVAKCEFNSPQKAAVQAEPAQESRDQRTARLYAHQSGPFIGWLLDECRRREQDYSQMAREVGVTYGYINQLRTGVRQTQHISNDFAAACARYLGVPTIVVKIVAGQIPMSDFVHPHESEDDMLQRAVRAMMDDPVVRRSVPADVHELPTPAKRAMVAMYIESSGRDLLNAYRLPEMVRYLQRAVVIHDESEGEAQRGHRAAI